MSIDSRIIVRALENVINRIYTQRTTTVFIVVQTSFHKSNVLTPKETAGEMLRFENNNVLFGSIIENNVSLMVYHRFFNIFLIDSYDSFK